MSVDPLPPVEPGALRRRLVTPPPAIDIALAVAFALFVLAEAWLGREVESRAWYALLAGVPMLLLAWRRRFPLVVAAAVVTANLVLNPAGEFSTLLALVLVCFTVGSETRPPWSYLGLLIVVVPFVLVSARAGLVPSDLAAGLVFFVGPWIVGVVVQSRAHRTEVAVARAEQLERDRDAEAVRVAAEERRRIARELHDIVSHSISVVTIQTQAVRRRLGPEHAAEAADLAAVEATAREALTEMRRLFGVLRADGESASLAPQPGLGELPRLVAQAGGGDLTVTLRIEGEPVELPPGLDLAAYRIAQEGLTNALRHARATTADVLVRYAPGTVEVVVSDDGRGYDGAAGGHGLVGIRERVALYGGAVELTSEPGRGTRLAATLPTGGTP